MYAQSNRADRSRGQMEAAARSAIETHAGCALTDAQWAAARARLLEFAGILRDWGRKTAALRRGNVEVLCQPEP
jgi:Rieske Fe-S protein